MIMRRLNHSSFTLVELVIAIMLLGVLVLSFFSIDLFTRGHAQDSERRAQLQNVLTFVIEHMKKNITGTASSGGAVGDPGAAPLNFTAIAGENSLRVWVDQNPNGMRDGSDRELGYRYHPANYQIWYYDSVGSGSYEVLTRGRPGSTNSFILGDFSVINSGDFNQPTQLRYNSVNNYLDVKITACWDATGASGSCGSMGNPSVSMHARLYMPSVSTN